MRGEEEHLKKCPTCLTPVDEAKLGLRDYASWLTEALPSKVGAMDVDFFLEQSKTGRALIMEFKPKGAWIPVGQKVSLKRLAKVDGFDVWVVWEDKDGSIEVGALDEKGGTLIVEKTDRAGLKKKVSDWWKEGYE